MIERRDHRPSVDIVQGIYGPLIGQEALYRALMDQIWDAVIIRDIHGRVCFWNHGAERAYGWSASETLGRKSHAFLKTRLPGSLEEIKDYLLRNGYWEGELEHGTRDGACIVVASHWTLECDENGEPAAVLEINNNITERKRIEEKLRRSEELFKRTFEAAGVGIAHVAPNGRWLRVNTKLCEISGYSREELLEKTFLELTPPEDRQASLERIQQMLAGNLGPYSIERRYICKDGSRIWVDLSVSLVREPSGEPEFFECKAEDITERKLAEMVSEPLTDREMEVLQLVAGWQTNQEIAQEIQYSKSTIKLHIQNILTKLGTKDRRRAVARAVYIGLIPPPR